MNDIANISAKPWYREPWPWLLMSGPAIVVVAGFLTLGFAIQSFDGMVVDDYYKQGKAINLSIARDMRAQSLGYHAELAHLPDGSFRVAFTGAQPQSRELTLQFRHPTRADSDHQITLVRAEDSSYRSPPLSIGINKWNVTLVDHSLAWRLRGSLLASRDRVTLSANE